MRNLSLEPSDSADGAGEISRRSEVNNSFGSAEGRDDAMAKITYCVIHRVVPALTELIAGSNPAGEKSWRAAASLSARRIGRFAGCGCGA